MSRSAFPFEAALVARFSLTATTYKSDQITQINVVVAAALRNRGCRTIGVPR